MKLKASRYLDDGKLFNQGQEATLIEIESPEDFDQLWANIESTGYYGRDYYERNLAHGGRRIKLENLPLAEMAHLLRPRSVLELGCGSGDVLFLLGLAGHQDLTGVDLSPQARETAQPEVAESIVIGEAGKTARELAGQGRRFDLVMGFDIWEHLHPAQLDQAISDTVAVGSEDALFFFMVPGFGNDRVFGEPHPLEVEENREDIRAGRPFRHLLAEVTEPPIPTNGHLTWAPANWWEERYASHGLVRLDELERALHAMYDPYLARAQQSLFIFARDSQPALARAGELLASMGHALLLWRTRNLMFRALWAHCRAKGEEVIDLDGVAAGLDDAMFRVQDRVQAELGRLTGEVVALKNEARELHFLIQRNAWLRRQAGRFVPRGLKARVWGMLGLGKDLTRSPGARENA